MMEVERLAYPNAEPGELEKKRLTEGFTVGCRAYASAFLSQFMQNLDKSVGQQKQASKLVGALRKAQMETDHYLRKLKSLKEQGEKADKIAGNETKLQQAIAAEEQLQAESIKFLNVFLTRAPTELFAANLELLLAQDEFSKTLNECAKFTLENPPQWMQEICRTDQSMTMRAQRASRRSSLPINATSPLKGIQSGSTQQAAGGVEANDSASDLSEELEKLRIQNKKGAAAYENLRSKAVEYKDECESLRKRLAEVEEENGKLRQSAGSTQRSSTSGSANAGFADFGFATAAPPKQQRPGTPAFSFDPSSQSLI